MTTAQARGGAARAVNSRIENYRNLSCAERLSQAVAAAGLADADLALLAQPGGLPLNLANGMIENVVGTFELPLGVATNFRINGRDWLHVVDVLRFDADGRIDQIHAYVGRGD